MGHFLDPVLKRRDGQVKGMEGGVSVEERPVSLKRNRLLTITRNEAGFSCFYIALHIIFNFVRLQSQLLRVFKWQGSLRVTPTPTKMNRTEVLINLSSRKRFQILLWSTILIPSNRANIYVNMARLTEAFKVKEELGLQKATKSASWALSSLALAALRNTWKEKVNTLAGGLFVLACVFPEMKKFGRVKKFSPFFF